MTAYEMRISDWSSDVCSSDLIALVTLAGVFYTAPNFMPKATLEAIPSFLPHKQINLGLDLRGGSYLLLQVDTATANKDRLQAQTNDVRKALLENKIAYRSEEHTSELQSLMRISYAVFCLKKKKISF